MKNKFGGLTICGEKKQKQKTQNWPVFDCVSFLWTAVNASDNIVAEVSFGLQMLYL